MRRAARCAARCRPAGGGCWRGGAHRPAPPRRARAVPRRGPARAQPSSGRRGEGAERGRRGHAQGRGDREPYRAGGQPDRPGRRDQHAETGRDPLPPRKPSQTGNNGPARRRTRPAAPPPARRRHRASSTAAAPLPPSSSRVAAARARRPVRSTLVAPILPEPTWRMSPSPAARVSSRPNGIEPSR